MDRRTPVLIMLALALVAVAVAGPALATPFGSNSVTVRSITVGPVTTPTVVYQYGCYVLPYELTVGNSTVLYTPMDLVCPGHLP